MKPLEALRDAARTLQPERTADALAHVFEAWRAPGSRWLGELCARQTPYSASALEAAVRLALRDWSREAIAAWLERELRTPCRGPLVSGVFVAGSIPTNAFALISAPLLAGSAVCAHPSRADPHTLPLFHDALAEHAPEVADAIALSFDPEPALRCDAVIVEGSDATVATLRARVPPETLFIGYGHRISAAAVGAGAELETASGAVALDAALFDGRGCLSPAYVLVEDRPPGRATAFARRLAAALARLEARWPRGRLTAEEHLALRELRARWAAREESTLEVAPRGTDWAVAELPFDGRLPAPGCLRHLPVLRVADAIELATTLEACAPHLSALAHAGLSLDRAEVAQLALAAGASRVCPLGHLQRPPIGWRHDGRGAIDALLRFVDVEGSD